MLRIKYCVTFLMLFLCLSWYAIFLSGKISNLSVGSDLTMTVGGDADTFVSRFVLDAGHGGEDGGAVGYTGVVEKDLNFEICQMLGTLLKASGNEVVYTRTQDKLLYTEEQNIKGMRKVYDLKNRLEISNRAEGALLISIHMNTFPLQQYRGLQVWYAANSDMSRRVANAVQTSVQNGLQPDNRRVVRASDSSLYLLSNAKNPAILIECGFLSNPTECEKLSDKAYQKRLCFFIFCAMMNMKTQETGFLI